MVDLKRINSWTRDEASAAFLRCCGATLWARQMAARRPFADEADLFAVAEQAWQGLAPADWRQAFAAHPRIGDLDAARSRFASAASEQAGVVGTSEAVLLALAEGNRAYEEKFGYLFIVCATGKSADEMLAILQKRLRNSPLEELSIAAAEQKQIARLRLQKV